MQLPACWKMKIPDVEIDEILSWVIPVAIKLAKILKTCFLRYRIAINTFCDTFAETINTPSF
jgi:hypothetical protein